MKSFTPSDPMNTYKTQKEIENWRAELEKKKDEEKRQAHRYWLTTGISIAALVKAFWPELSAAVAWLLTLLER